jgi:hypothetical protein
MKAKIIGVDPLKESRAEKSFRRVYFLMEDGKWAKSDIVPAYRNFKIWKPIILLFESGATVFLEGIEMRQPQEVDADSIVRVTPVGFEVRKVQEKKVIQEKLL